MDDRDRAMTIKEVAKFLNISTQMVYNLVKDGRLKAFKIGTASRIMYSDVLDFIYQQKEDFARNRVNGENRDDSVFVVNQLSMRKEDFQIADVTFALPIGKIMTLIGPSGSGKTLLLKAISGLESIDSGTVFLGTTRLDPLPPAKRKVGFVFEDYALFPHMTAKRNVEFPRFIQKRMPPGTKAKIEDFIATETNKRIREVHLESLYLDHLPKQLPEGIKQLVAIARERNHEFELFLMDEPMTRLDAAQHVQMRIFIRKVVHDLGKTTIISSNDPEDALLLSDYIGVMAEGKLLQFGETWDVYHHPVNLMVMEMTSRLAVNTARVEISAGRTDPYNLQVDLEDGTYDLAFRSEEIELSEEGIPAKVKFTRFFDGSRQLAFCEISEGIEVKLVLPVETEETVSFVPAHPQFFRVEGE